MKVDLIRYTPDPDGICGIAAALCTNYQGDPIKALHGALQCGHESVAEHASFTFMIEGVSRVLLAQLTRHRIASFSVQSQRYAGLAENSEVVPYTILNSDMVRDVSDLLDDIHGMYTRLVAAGVPEEDARYIIPQGIGTKLVVTMNARELRHFFALRCCNRAQTEIRELADRMLALVYPVAPGLFVDAGPGCINGHCPEGRRTCHSPRNKDIQRIKIGR